MALCGARWSLARHTSHLDPAPTNACHAHTHRRFLKTTRSKNSGSPQDAWNPARKGDARTESTHPRAPPHDVAPNLCVFPHRCGQLKAAVQAQTSSGTLSGIKLKMWVNQLEQHKDHAAMLKTGRCDATGNLACNFLVCPRLPCHSPSLLTAHTPHNTQCGRRLPCSTQRSRRLAR